MYVYGSCIIIIYILKEGKISGPGCNMSVFDLLYNIITCIFIIWTSINYIMQCVVYSIDVILAEVAAVQLKHDNLINVNNYNSCWVCVMCDIILYITFILLSRYILFCYYYKMLFSKDTRRGLQKRAFLSQEFYKAVYAICV